MLLIFKEKVKITGIVLITKLCLLYKNPLRKGSMTKKKEAILGDEMGK